MAIFQPVIRRKRADGLNPVYIRVTHNRKVAYMKTDKIVDSKGLGKHDVIKDPFVLQSCAVKIARYVEMLNKVETTSWSATDVVSYINSGTADVSFSDYARKFHANMYNMGQERNARNYELAYQHLERYAGTKQVMFSHLTSAFINGWIKELSSTARAKEMYPVCVRQIFKQALIEYNDYDAGIIRITTNPWVKIKIPKADTPEKKAITLEACRAFFTCPLPPTDRINPLPELGRDVAMMIICLAGINTVDIFNLKKSNYNDGIISYERAKTRKARADNAYMEMRVPGILKPIVEKYLDRTDSEFLFNFHSRLTNSDSFNANVNIGIKAICTDVLGMKKGKGNCYSAYTFRHTWATIAQNDCGASLSDVGFAMNHSDKTRITRTYVKIDFSPAWKLNEQVIDKIFFSEEESNRNKNDEDEKFERFSFKSLIKGTLFFRGKTIASIEDIGFNNVNEVIEKLMKQVPEDIPPRCMVQIRIENKDKGQKQDYTRTIA